MQHRGGRGEGLGTAAVVQEIRCLGCGALLGVREPAGLSIKRGEMQAVVSGMFQVAVVCWRSRCRKLTVLEMDTSQSRRAVTAAV